MPDSWRKSAFRGIFRRYLSRFPLRDGKAWFYERFHAGLTPADRRAVVDFMISSLGRRYDTQNVVDLVRYLLPTPPVPVRWRRRMLALGSGEPTRAICSSLIAEAFGRINYPILPVVEPPDPSATRPVSAYSRGEILHIRHHSLYTPRDFDLSPFFRVVKPTIERGFDYKELRWS